MNDFFSYFTPTGSVSEGPAPKRRKTTLGVPPAGPTPTPAQDEPEQAEPPEGHPASATVALYRPSFAPLQQNMYAYDCYNVDIQDPKYNTFSHVPQCPPDKGCYCGLKFNTQDELSVHISTVHKNKVYKCSDCGTKCKNNRATWKHFRSQHLYTHTHHCTIASCQLGKNNKPYGNDDQCLVWMHMQKHHSLKSPLGCPKCTKTFSSPKYQLSHIKTKHDLAPKK